MPPPARPVGSLPPVLALVGPTGSGKSALALEAARLAVKSLAPGNAGVPAGSSATAAGDLSEVAGSPGAAAGNLGALAGGVEIVAVDAFTVYHGMDIGTAKPTPADRAQVPHHLLDVLEPERDCTVQWFQREARAAIDDVRRRGAVPLLVGGSGLYFRAVVDPLEFPPTDPEVRGALQRRFGEDPAAAHAELRRVDPDAAGRMDPGNVRRAVRALEVWQLTGRRFSDWRQAWDRYDQAVPPGLVVFGVDVPREELTRRIDARTTAMLEAGWLDECATLYRRALSATARQALGYQELFDHLDGRCTLDEAAERIRARTRRYAAYQARWFRKDPRVRWLPASRLVEEMRRCVS